MMFTLGLSYMTFIILRYVPSMPSFWRVFNHKWVLNFVKCFLCICWNNQMVFIFQFVNMMYLIDWFMYTEEFLHPGAKAHLIIMYEVFNMLLDSVVRILLRILHPCSSVTLACNFLFLWHHCFWYQVDGGLVMSLGVCLHLQFFWKSLSRIGVSWLE